MDLKFKVPQRRLLEVAQPRWLAKNQALLLDMSTAVDLGSYTMPDERRLLYDFRSGELLTCSDYDGTPCTALEAAVKELNAQ